MAGRPRQFDPDTAIEKYVELFWTNGFERTSVDDLQAAVGIKRGSFYAAFGDKNRACTLALDRYIGTNTAGILAVLEAAGNPVDGLCAFLRAAGRFMADNAGRGCLFFSLCSDVEGLPEEVARFLRQHEHDFFARVERRVRDAGKAGLLPEGQSSAAATSFVRAVLFGLNGMARVGALERSILQAAETAATAVHYWPRMARASSTRRGAAQP